MNGFIVDEELVLQHVDEYSLYCHYLEYDPEIKVNYTSPLRDGDNTPSFGLFQSKKFKNIEYMWKDSGGTGDSGGIFKLVQLMFGYKTKYQAVQRIASDFGLGPTQERTERIIKKTAIIRSDSDIRIRPKPWSEQDFGWWKQFNISKEILEQYKTSSLYCYWLTPSQKAPVFPSGLSYVYRVYNKYQLYFPANEKGRKFRHDLQEQHVHGIEQLTYSTDTLIITKSRKDVMCLRSFGYDAVSPRSENTPMPEGFFEWADTKYKNKLVLFDNDMKHRGEWYPYDKIYIPIDSGTKDISDFTKLYSPANASELLKTIIV